MEGLFYTTFREHMIGQPTNGNRDTMSELTLKHIVDHRDHVFAGKNFCIVATGDVNHNQVVEVASPFLNKLPLTTVKTNEESLAKPYMTPSMMS